MENKPTLISLENLAEFKSLYEQTHPSGNAITLTDPMNTSANKKIFKKLIEQHTEDASAILIYKGFVALSINITDDSVVAVFPTSDFTNTESEYGIEGANQIICYVKYELASDTITFESEYANLFIPKIGTGNAPLGTKNTVAYTPTALYHPATKKYVDDKATSVVVFDGQITDANKKLINEVSWKLGYDEPCVLTYHNNPAFHIELALDQGDKVRAMYYFLDSGEHFTEAGAGIIGINIDTFHNYGMEGRKFKVSKVMYDEASDMLTVTDDEIELHLITKGTPLSTDNTTQFTPEGDYNPATKKYVDDTLADSTSSFTNRLNGVESSVETLTTADAANVKLTDAQEIAGVKTFTSSPVVPEPAADTDAANKKYVLDQISAAISKLNGLEKKIVTSLEEMTDENALYLIKSESTGLNDIYDEYLVIEGKPEKIGSTRVDVSNLVDLTSEQTIDGIKTFTNAPISETTPTSNSQVANKKYVDDTTNAAKTALQESITNLTEKDAQNVKLDTEQTITGVKTFDTLPISTTTPTTSNQLTNKNYVDNQVTQVKTEIETDVTALTNTVNGFQTKITNIEKQIASTVSADQKIKIVVSPTQPDPIDDTIILWVEEDVATIAANGLHGVVSKVRL